MSFVKFFVSLRFVDWGRHSCPRMSNDPMVNELSGTIEQNNDWPRKIRLTQHTIYLEHNATIPHLWSATAQLVIINFFSRDLRIHHPNVDRKWNESQVVAEYQDTQLHNYKSLDIDSPFRGIVNDALNVRLALWERIGTVSFMFACVWLSHSLQMTVLL